MTSKPLFVWDAAATSALEATLSPERLSTYLKATGGDLPSALRLHIWNTAVSSAFRGPLEYLEVALRNALTRELALRFGAQWYDNAACRLAPLALNAVAQAKQDLLNDGKSATPPDMIPRLSLGFWVALLQRRNESTLWRTCLYRAFPHARISRRDAHDRLEHLRKFRNRIAHLEPVFHRHLSADHHSILTVAGWICPQTRVLIAYHTRITELLALTPTDGSTF